MIEIEQNDFKDLFKIFEEVKWELSSFSVLGGNNPGRVFISSDSDKTSAFMMTPEGWLLAGNPEDKEFNKELKQLFENDILRNYEDDFEIYFLPKWEKVAEEIFSAHPLFKYKRYHYKAFLKELDIADEKSGILGKIQQINSDFVKSNLTMKNMDSVDEWILNNWGTYENFEKKGFGFYILKNNIVLSWSVADCVYKDACEIGIHTDEAHRKQGLAVRTVNAMLKYAKDNAFSEVGWQCGATNIGSYKTAEKCGFKRMKEYFGYTGSTDKNEHYFGLILDNLFLAHDVKKSKEIFKNLDSDVEFKNYQHYDIACGFAENGEKDFAFQNLKVAIKKGFNHKRHIMNDEDLSTLRDSEEWNEIMELLNDAKRWES